MDAAKAQERVLVIPEDHFRRVGFFRGFRPHSDEYLSAILDPSRFSFRARGEVEDNPSFKQLIPYVVLRHGERIFHYRRGSSGTETRLRSLRSVGIGGHISEEDGDIGQAFRRGMMRELHEEVHVPSLVEPPTPLGLIYDDRTPVGSVHLGVAYLFELSTPEATPREAAIAESGFASLADLRDDRESFETWSHFVFDELTARTDW
jgi:predicted NUDIX family phosphoesterase